MDAAAEVRAQCARLGWTQERLAVEAGVSWVTAQGACKGRAIMPRKARAIVAALFKEPRPDVVAGLCLVEGVPRG